MRIRWIVFSFITLCMIAGLVAGVFSRSIEAALTIQKLDGAPQTNATPSPATTPKGTPTKTTTPVATSMPGGVNVLAKDSFQRAAQTFWGKASDGRLWQGDANSVEVFSIKGGAGQIDHGQGAFNAVLGPVSANAEVIFTSSVNHFANGGKVNSGAALRWVDGNNWYKALIDGTQLQLLSRINGTTKSLATMPFPAQDGISYTLRFRVVGANLFAKVWLANQPEPAAWMLTVTDTALTQGMGGIRVLLQNASVIRVTSFLETTVGSTV
ncbi:MAG TPA: hypothetical protein VEL72_05425 [Ktedonobacteraceae bacterium]|nr:hypothetical protein [Ktedonobacteraceae bacterium]